MPVFKPVNHKLLEVELLGDEIYSRRGGMVAYTGEVSFSRSAAGNEGLQGMAMRAATNEGLSLMMAKGRGKVYFAHYGMDVTLITLRGERLFLESSNLLAFDAHLRSSTVFMGNQGLQGLVRGATSGQGLFTTTLEGNGEVAMLSDGDVVELEVSANRTIFVDPDAYLGHKGNVSSTFVTDVNWKTFLGQTSGESYQLKFTGVGVVYIQASER